MVSKSSPLATSRGQLAAGSFTYRTIQSQFTTVHEKFNAKDISDWYKDVSHATAAWRSFRDDVAYISFTNKSLSREAMKVLDADFFLHRPFSVIITADQLEAVIPA